MSCEHAETTTVAWLYGEGPEDHAEHIAGCLDCQTVTEQHAEVAVATSDVTPALRRAAEPAHEAAPKAANTTAPRWVTAVGGLVFLAASMLLVVRAPESEAPSALDDSPQVAVADGPTSAERDAALIDELDLVLDDLDAELDELSDDMNSL